MAAASRLLHQKLQEAAAGYPGDPSEVTLRTLRKLVLDDYAANGRRSVREVTRAYERLEEVLGDMPASKVPPPVVTGYIAKRLEDKAAPATINRELAQLRRGFRLAVRGGLLPHRPDFSLLAEHNARKGFLERSALADIVERLPAWARGPVLMAAETGWRVSEILSRQWRHVELREKEGGTIRLEPGESKSGEGREFPLTQLMRSVLEEARAVADEMKEQPGSRLVPWVWHRDGEEITTGVLRYAWTKAAKDSGHPGALLHDLRRSRVREMERASVSRSVAMSLVGHKTQSIYSRYAIVDRGAQEDAIAKLDCAPTVTDRSKQVRSIRSTNRRIPAKS
jgi:integrase